MKSIDLKAFRKANNISQVELAEYLGVGQSFISQIEKGTRPLPEEYISRLSANPKWDSSMLISERPFLSSMDYFRRERTEPTQEQIHSAVMNAIDPTEKFLINYLERKIDDQEKLIRELYQQIGMLEAKLNLYHKGESAVEGVDPSSSASAV